MPHFFRSQRLVSFYMSCSQYYRTMTISSSSLSSSNAKNNLVLYNSLDASLHPVVVVVNPPESNALIPETQRPGLLWYTCGPTVYDSAHLGHARTYVCMDILHRLVLSQSQDSPLLRRPIFIMNITDVDDKILIRAKELNISPVDLAKKYEAEFWQDMDALHVLRPTLVTRVTEHVDLTIIPYIEQILKKGMAYVDEDTGSVYFDVQRFEALDQRRNRYGKLVQPRGAGHYDDSFFSWETTTTSSSSSTTTTTTTTTTTATTTTTTTPHQQQHMTTEGRKKKDPRDFALWKGRFDGDEGMQWKSPWGLGRPGWHIECSAMIHYCASMFPSYRVQVHAGGIDLKFPHHTNEIAQAEAHDYVPDSHSISSEWIPHWIHTGHLHIHGLKMSKSLKNFITIRSLFQSESESESTLFHSPSDDFRLWCLGLSGSYRAPATYSEDRLKEAKITREKIIRFLLDGQNFLNNIRQSNAIPNTIWNDKDFELFEKINLYKSQCTSHLLDDLDGTRFLNSLMEMVDIGSFYVRNNVEVKTCPEVPLRTAIESIRDLLKLVGFTDKTVDVGLHNHHESSPSSVLGGEAALIEEVVSLRSQVRTSAIQTLRNNDVATIDPKRLGKQILKACDDSRSRLSEMGVELFDGGTAGAWKLIPPKKKACP